MNPEPRESAKRVRNGCANYDLRHQKPDPLEAGRVPPHLTRCALSDNQDPVNQAEVR
jgi:hypothetical protein